MTFSMADRAMMVLFLVAALVHLASPAPLLGVVVYGMAGILCAVEAGKVLTPRIAWLYVAVSGAAAGAVIVRGGHLAALDAVGMLLAAGWTGVLGVRARRREIDSPPG